ncbi:MAG: hypothetical protein K8M05_29660 [Deltaproteobacteria bacterium]|nr:hypothetical protein [Kofleriaceae bacterium]
MTSHQPDRPSPKRRPTTPPPIPKRRHPADPPPSASSTIPIRPEDIIGELDC